MFCVIVICTKNVFFKVFYLTVPLVFRDVFETVISTYTLDILSTSIKYSFWVYLFQNLTYKQKHKQKPLKKHAKWFAVMRTVRLLDLQDYSSFFLKVMSWKSRFQLLVVLFEGILFQTRDSMYYAFYAKNKILWKVKTINPSGFWPKSWSWTRRPRYILTQLCEEL